MPYTVTAVQPNPRPWNSQKGGPMLSYRVDLQDSQGHITPNVEWAKKQDSPAPQVGETSEGNLNNTEYGFKFKAAYSGGGGGGARGKSPEESAAIQRMHIQKTAPSYAEFLLTIGVVEQPKDDKEAFALLQRVMSWLEKDIERAKRNVTNPPVAA